jgi:hypothetical protein
MQPDRFPDPPADPITDHGLPDRARQGEADPRPIRFRFTNAKGREERVGVAGTLVVNSSEVFGTQEADTFRKTSDGELPLGADSKFYAPSSSPP